MALKELDDRRRRAPRCGTSSWRRPVSRRCGRRRSRAVPSPPGPRFPAPTTTETGWRRERSYRVARPFLFRFDPERIHRLTLRILASRAPIRESRARGPAGGVDRAAVAHRGARRASIPQPDRGRRGLRQGRPRRRRLGGPRAWIRRGGHGDAGGTGRQPAAAPVPAAGRRGAHQPDGVQQRWRGGARTANHAGSPPPASRRGDRGEHRTGKTDPGRAVDDYLACHRLVAPVADYLAINVAARTRRACATSNRPRPLPTSLHDLMRRVSGAAPGRPCS